MKKKQTLVPILSLVVLTSQLTGCATLSSAETFNEVTNGSEVILEYNELDSSYAELKQDIEKLAARDNLLAKIGFEQSNVLEGEHLIKLFEIVYTECTNEDNYVRNYPTLESRIQYELKCLSAKAADLNKDLPEDVEQQYKNWRPYPQSEKDTEAQIEKEKQEAIAAERKAKAEAEAKAKAEAEAKAKAEAEKQAELARKAAEEKAKAEAEAAAKAAQAAAKKQQQQQSKPVQQSKPAQQAPVQQSKPVQQQAPANSGGGGQNASGGNTGSNTGGGSSSGSNGGLISPEEARRTGSRNGGMVDLSQGGTVNRPEDESAFYAG